MSTRAKKLHPSILAFIFAMIFHTQNVLAQQDTMILIKTHFIYSNDNTNFIVKLFHCSPEMAYFVQICNGAGTLCTPMDCKTGPVNSAINSTILEADFDDKVKSLIASNLPLRLSPDDTYNQELINKIISQANFAAQLKETFTDLTASIKKFETPDTTAKKKSDTAKKDTIAKNSSVPGGHLCQLFRHLRR